MWGGFVWCEITSLKEGLLDFLNCWFVNAVNAWVRSAFGNVFLKSSLTKYFNRMYTSSRFISYLAQTHGIFDYFLWVQARCDIVVLNLLLGKMLSTMKLKVFGCQRRGWSCTEARGCPYHTTLQRCKKRRTLWCFPHTVEIINFRRNALF